MKLVRPRLVARDVKGLARFYEEILGIGAIGSDDFVELRGLVGSLGISSRRSVEHFSPAVAEPEANRSVILDFEVKDLDNERSRLKHLVREFLLEPTDQPSGYRCMLFRDPEGNLINFLMRTHVPTARPVVRSTTESKL
jgi:catechol-2,3-dioxygenase